jgi:hypothetical protein
MTYRGFLYRPAGCLGLRRREGKGAGSPPPNAGTLGFHAVSWKVRLVSYGTRRRLTSRIGDRARQSSAFGITAVLRGPQSASLALASVEPEPDHHLQVIRQTATPGTSMLNIRCYLHQRGRRSLKYVNEAPTIVPTMSALASEEILSQIAKRTTAIMSIIMKIAVPILPIRLALSSP